MLSGDYLTSVYGGAEWQAAWAGDPKGTGRSGFPADLRQAGPQQVTERAALRLVLEHMDTDTRMIMPQPDDFQPCAGTTVQQQSAATAAHDTDLI